MRHFRPITLALAAALATTVSALAIANENTAAPAAAELRSMASAIFQPIPDPPTEIRGEKITPEKIELGRMLFFEPRLSRSHIISCNTCHSIGTGGADNVPVSIGHGWQKGPRNSPTVFNAVFNAAQFWDGRADDLMEQAKGPVQASVEMNNTSEQVEITLRSMPEYVEAFRTAFPGEESPVTFDNMARVLEAFQSTLVTPDSRFDLFLKGSNDALDAEERQGLSLFINKACIACHSGVNLGGQAYFPFGVIQRPGADILPAEDKGRFSVTNTATDEYVFRASPLRNVALTAPYFHSGEVWDLKQAVAIMGSSQLGHTQTDDEAGSIARFLETLTGIQPKVEYPTLPRSTATTPKPE